MRFGNFTRVVPVAWVVCLLLLACTHPEYGGRQTFHADPDPTLNPPASSRAVAIMVDGARINGQLYLAAGAGNRPVVIFLHGYPGNEKNLDLAHAVRRAGYQSLYVDYRGVWGSGGTFSFQGALEDVQATLSWVRSPENAIKYHFEVGRIALVGHSLGGWLALMTARAEAESVCVAALAAWNVGWAAGRFDTHPDELASNLADFEATTDLKGGPVRANPSDLIDELAAHQSEWDYLQHAGTLHGRAILLAAATRDTPDEDIPMHQNLARALDASGETRVTLQTYEDDHGFSSHRVTLAETITQWLARDCATTWAADG